MKKITPVVVKLIFIGVIIGILCIANCMIGGKMKDREATYRDAQNSIIRSAGGYFSLKTAYIAIPYSETYVDYENNKYVTKHRKGWLSIVPEKIKYDADLKSEIRTLGIYEAPVFTGDLRINASFNVVLPKNTNDFTYDYKNTLLILPMASTNLCEKPVYEINKKNYETYLYSSNPDIRFDDSGVACNINIYDGQVINFSTVLKIKGAKQFCIKVGNSESKLNVTSDWKSPGFTDFTYLPDSRQISDDGFTANWSIPFAYESSGSDIGFNYVEPVNLYKKLDRAQNYAFLFIIVPFIILFLFEIFALVELHPMHYLLSGAASVIFFLLLLSFSEHITFTIAYVIGALASGLLVSLYVISITKKIKLGSIMSLLFVLLYSYLFFCIKSEDYALLIGSVFAFVLLAVIMFVTRNVNWSNLKKSSHTDLI